MFRSVGIVVGVVSLALGATAVALPPPTFADLGLINNSGYNGINSFGWGINASGQVTGY